MAAGVGIGVIRWSIALLVLVLAGCGQSTGAPRRTPSPPPPSSSGPPLALVGKGSEVPPSGRVDFSCSLPVLDEVTTGNPMRVEHIQFPNGVVAVDRGASIQALGQKDEYSWDRPAFYDAAVSRWLPVGPVQAAPDGFHYAYLTGGGGVGENAFLHVVDVRTQSDESRVLAGVGSGSSAPNSVVDFDGRTAYLSWEGGLGSLVPGFGTGLWAADATTGQLRQLLTSDWVEAVRSGSAWVGDAPEVVGGEAFIYHAITRVDLATGIRQRWFFRADANSWIVGFDGHGSPVVATQSNSPKLQGPVELRVVSLAGATGSIITPDAAPVSKDSRVVPLQGDGDRIWFGSDHGIYLWTQAAGLREVVHFNGEAGLVEPAGVCV